MLKLKLYSPISREDDRGVRNDPKKPLTGEMKQRLRTSVWDSCRAAYVNRMKKSALVDEVEETGDLEGSAWIFFENILSKFDLAPFEGKISKFDVPGVGKPKTLEFYFKWYFSYRVNLNAREARQNKKDRGIGPAENMSEYSYDVEDNSHYSQYNSKYEVTGEILAEVKKKDPEFQRFFEQAMVMQYPTSDLKEEYKEKYKTFKAMLDDITRKYQAKYKLQTKRGK